VKSKDVVLKNFVGVVNLKMRTQDASPYRHFIKMSIQNSYRHRLKNTDAY